MEKATVTHSSTLAWKIPWMEEPGRLQSIGLQRAEHNSSILSKLEQTAVSCHNLEYSSITRVTANIQHTIYKSLSPYWASFVARASLVAQTACNAGDLGSILGSVRSPGEGNGNPVQYSCLENSMDGGTSQATVHGVTKSQTRLSDFTFTFCLCFPLRVL